MRRLSAGHRCSTLPMMTSNDPAAPLAAFAAGWNAGDGTAIAAAFTPDAQFVNVVGHVLDGRDAIAAQHQRILDGIYRGTRAEFPAGAVRLLGTCHALIGCNTTVHNVAHAPPGVALPADGIMRSRLVLVTVATDAGWQIMFAQNTVIVAMP